MGNAAKLRDALDSFLDPEILDSGEAITRTVFKGTQFKNVRRLLEIIEIQDEALGVIRDATAHEAAMRVAAIAEGIELT